jgi:ribosomal protein RSM22 (predicted rRNA methylase)
VPADLELADQIDLESQFNKEVHKIMNIEAQRWAPVEYDKEAAWSYFVGTKAAFDYSCLKLIMEEIKRKETQFQPRTLLDFGSGVGTGSW